MSGFGTINWAGVFSFDTPVLEIIVRGSLTYLALLVMMRVVLKRQSGSLGITDVLVIVLIADASQNAMAGSYNSVPDGILLVSTLIFWNFALDWLGYRIPFIERLLTPSPLMLVLNGKMLRRNMREELVTVDDLMSQLRLQGIDDIEQVKRAFLESDGKFSVIKK